MRLRGRRFKRAAGFRVPDRKPDDDIHGRLDVGACDGPLLGLTIRFQSGHRVAKCGPAQRVENGFGRQNLGQDDPVWRVWPVDDVERDAKPVVAFQIPGNVSAGPSPVCPHRNDIITPQLVDHGRTVQHQRLVGL